MYRLIQNERGITLLEVIITMLVIVLTVLSIYTGIVYAEKQLLRNYHDRVATLLASGEMEWQYYYQHNYKEFQEYINREVIIDRLPKGRLIKGKMTCKSREAFESASGTNLTYKIVEISISWTEPTDKKGRKIVIREDFYN